MRPLLATSVLGFAGYGLLLPVAPLWALHGGAEETGAGAVNAVLMAATVLAQTAVHSALRRWGWRPVLVTGALALGVPSLLMPLSSTLGAVLALSAVRGIGFAIVTVGGSSAVAQLVPPALHGRAVGLYGLGIAAPQMVLVPLGPLLTTVLPIWTVFALGALPVLAVLCAPALSRALSAAALGTSAADGGTAVGADSPAQAGTGTPAAPPVGAPSGAARPPLVRSLVLLTLPVLCLLVITAPGGALLSFAPQLSPSALATSVGLFALTASATLSRWLLGHVADRWGAPRAIPPLLLVGAAGLALCAHAPQHQTASVLVTGMLVVGIAYGGLQNVTLVAAFGLTPARRDLASTVWNMGFDVGTGIGSLALGAVAARLSYTAGIDAAAVLCLAAALIAVIWAARLRRPPVPG